MKLKIPALVAFIPLFFIAFSGVASAFSLPLINQMSDLNNNSGNFWSGEVECSENRKITAMSFLSFDNWSTDLETTLTVNGVSVNKTFPVTPDNKRIELYIEFPEGVECGVGSVNWSLDFNRNTNVSFSYVGTKNSYNFPDSDLVRYYDRARFSTSIANYSGGPRIPAGKVWYDIGDIAVVGEGDNDMGTTTETLTQYEQGTLLLLLLIWLTLVTIYMCFAIVSTYKKRKYLQYGGGDVEVRNDL